MILSIDGHWFLDDKGRKILLRGVNLGGSTKVPYPDGATQLPTDFSNHRRVSFVGRPFPLNQAAEHYERLQKWGFNTLRFLTTWEAIEHYGPGKYDEDYLDYLEKVVDIAGDYGFYVFIDPHQDVWSRMTGGDGAPGWTFEKVGLDYTKFGDSGAAKVMQYHYPDNYEEMEWSFNYGRFATATMFTLFFGGNDFAPNKVIDGKNIQDYLQQHFINSMKAVAHRVKDMEHVIGFDSLNEPHPGFIGIPDLDQLPDLRPPGQVAYPFDVLAAGAGYPRDVAVYALKLIWLREVSRSTLNPDGISNWLTGVEDVWQDHGIWDIKDNEPRLLQPDYFSRSPDGKSIEFFTDYLRPFITTYTDEIRSIMPESFIFIEGEPLNPEITWKTSDPKNIINASHWYDGYTLYTKSFKSWFTIDIETFRPVLLEWFVRRNFRGKLKKRKDISASIHDTIPTLIGEFGIPFDMEDKEAYRTGDFSKQIKALSMYYDLMDELQLHSTIWNYTADNTNQWGDLWNMEDLSIFSRDQQDNRTDLHSGGRAIEGFCRPFPVKIAGEPIEWIFDHNKRKFQFKYICTSSELTLLYIPEIHYPNGYNIEFRSDELTYEIKDQYLSLHGEQGDQIDIQITPI